MDNEEEHIIALLTSENSQNLLLSLELLKARPDLLSELVKEVLVFLHYRGREYFAGHPEASIRHKIEALNIQVCGQLNLQRYFYAANLLEVYLGDIGESPIRITKNNLVNNNIFFIYLIKISIFPELYESKFKHKKHYLDCLYQAIYSRMVVNNSFWDFSKVKEHFSLLLEVLNSWKLDSMPTYTAKPIYLQENYKDKDKFEYLLFKYSKSSSDLVKAISGISYWVKMVGNDYFFETMAKRTKDLNDSEQNIIINNLNLKIEGLDRSLKKLKKKQLLLDLEESLSLTSLRNRIQREEIDLQQLQRLLLQIRT